MTNDNAKPVVRTGKFNLATGEINPDTPEEQAAALADVRAAIRAGKLEFTDQVKQMLGLNGMTPEQIESWLAEKDS